MTRDQMYLRNDLAIDLVKIYATRPSKDDVLVDSAFDIADRIVARINADQATLNAELEAQRTKVTEDMLWARKQRAYEDARMANNNAASQRYNEQLCGAQINQPEVPLRRAEDKVEVQEISVGQAIEMIASILSEKQ